MTESSDRRQYRLRPERWLYIITDGERCKVGYAADVYTRLKQLQGGNHLALSVVDKWQFPCPQEAKDAECRAHGALSRWHIRGEWFRMSPDDVRRALDHMFCDQPKTLYLEPGRAQERYLTKRQKAMRDAGY